MLSKTGFGRNPLRKMSSLPASFAYSGSCPGGLDKLGNSKLDLSNDGIQKYMTFQMIAIKQQQHTLFISYFTIYF